MNTTIMDLLPTLSDLLVWQAKAAAVLLVTLGATVAMRTAPSRWRRRVLAWGLSFALVLPLVGAAAGPSVGVELPVTAIDLPSLAIDGAPSAGPVAALTHDATMVTTAAAVESSWTPSWSTILVGLWLGGLLLGASRVLRGLVGSVMLRRDSLVPSGRLLAIHHEVCDRAGASATLRMHPRPTVPIVVGVVRATVLLPSTAEGWSDQRLRAVLLHELGHVAHRDHQWFPLLALARTALWVDPLAWLLLHRFHREAEFAADDAVVDHGMRASTYAAELMELGRVSLQSVGPMPVPALGHPRLSERIGRVLQSPTTMARLRQVVPVGLGAVGAAVAIALLRAGPEPVEQVADQAFAPTNDEHPASPLLPRVDTATATTSLGTGPRLYLRPDELSLSVDGTRTDLRIPMIAGRLAEGAHTNHLIHALYDALSSHGAEERPSLVVLADVSMPWPTVVDALYTSGRAGLSSYALAVEIGDDVRAIDVSPPRFPSAQNAASGELRLRVNWAEGTERRFHLSPLAQLDGRPSLAEEWTAAADQVSAFGAASARACELGGGNPVQLVVRPANRARYGEIVDTIANLDRPCGGTTVLEAGD